MSDAQQVIDRYVSIWNETDAARRRDLIAATWAEDGTYLDPLMSGDGHAGIEAMMQGVQDQYPGHHVRLTSRIETVGDWLRFGWAFVSAATGTPLVAGVDFGHLGKDGRLQSITGFLEPAPASAEEG